MAADQRAEWARRRRALEAGHLEAWLGRGRGRLHLEHVPVVGRALEGGLEALGLAGRGRANALRPELSRVELAPPGLPPGLDGLTMLFLSDLHIDGHPGLAPAVAELVAGLRPDLCLLGGDYRFQARGPVAGAYRGMARVLAAVGARLGVYGVLGNHDFQEEASGLEALGVRVLVNQAVPVMRGGDRLWLVGLDDPHYYGCDDLAGALAGVPAGACKLLLVHSPEMYAEAAAAGVDVYLCGHTHGGQIRLPGLGAPVLNARCPRRYAAGVWRRGGMVGYTSRGLGCSLVPVRFRCRPEAVWLTLRRPAA